MRVNYFAVAAAAVAAGQVTSAESARVNYFATVLVAAAAAAGQVVSADPAC